MGSISSHIIEKKGSLALLLSISVKVARRQYVIIFNLATALATKRVKPNRTFNVVFRRVLNASSEGTVRHDVDISSWCRRRKTLMIYRPVSHLPPLIFSSGK
ncbi:hypothetical protein J6590_087081 [Homalodisca vitripennis]|nr:hypothetical protein J6590_087081 [Homalodisca vitripennis]